MLYLILLPNKKYAWQTDNVIFMGKYSESLAYGIWTFGIDKQELKKAFESLTNINNRVLFIDQKINKYDCI